MPAVDTCDAAPVACTLSPADMGARLVRIRQLTQSRLRSHSLQGLTLRLSYAPEVAAELADIVALERECCAFLAFHLTESPGAVELLITAPSSQGTGAQWLFAQFLPTVTERPPQEPALCGCRKGLSSTV
jgi:hypothetical protein